MTDLPAQNADAANAAPATTAGRPSSPVPAPIPEKFCMLNLPTISAETARKFGGNSRLVILSLLAP
jgi:hypothetical protein